MPRKNRGPLSEIFPPFNAGDLFVYFNDLLRQSGENGETKPNPPRDAWAADTAAAATAALSEAGANLEEGSSTVRDAIEFLGAAARSEQTKELNAIRQYKNKLLNELKDWKNAPELKRLIDELETLEGGILNQDFSQYEDFSAKLTKAINLIKQQQDDFISRLERLMASNKNPEFTTKELFGQQIQYRLYDDMEGIMKDCLGLYVKESANEEDNVAKTLRRCVEDFVFSNKMKLNNLSGTNIAALMAAVATDISVLAQQEFNREQARTGEIQKQISPEIYKRVYESYKKASGESLTKLQKAYKAGPGNPELLEILNNMKKGFGITKVNRSIEDLEKFQKKTTTNIENSIGKQRNRGAKILQETNVGKEIYNKLLDVKISSRTTGIHGNIEESVLSIIENAFLTTGRPATDSISLGSVIFNIETSANNEKFNELGREIRNTISDYVNKNVSQDRFDSLTDQYSEMNDKIQGLIDQLKGEVLNDPNLDQLFVFHGSIKSYMGAEGDITKREFSSFHGVQMQILSAFDRLYSMANIADVGFMQRDLLNLIALNLSSGALGYFNKEPLENYISIFAGLLMFDDIKNMALDAASMLENEPVQQVHVYILNDIYVPSSVILTNIYQQIREAFQTIDIGTAAKANITTGGIDSAIEAYDPHSYAMKQWETYAETARTSTLVTIYFLASFVDFINNIFGA